MSTTHHRAPGMPSPGLIAAPGVLVIHADMLATLAGVLAAYRRASTIRGRGLTPDERQLTAACVAAISRTNDTRPTPATTGNDTHYTASASAPLASLITAQELAARLRVSPRTVQRRARAFGGIKHAGRWYFPAHDKDFQQ
ncbi:helix-turn-helix domain-containing protein [Corynebacterium argentoratense]|uniref:helix-turn-helix domain-containing protein n=1 Tax=Corynebacterium argentoratense TaxID=42817 RepID=UPI001F2C4882|nr:helix-turn-helix domain-containing protein [Corynebacterium argentoratense]MCF1765220.1 helix-turn-helix domain-containing protein [Corynebacterium argentoratense]